MTFHFNAYLIIGPEKMKKISFAFAQNKIWEIGMTESKLVFKRKLQGEDEQLIMFRYCRNNLLPSKSDRSYTWLDILC